VIEGKSKKAKGKSNEAAFLTIIGFQLKKKRSALCWERRRPACKRAEGE
jgi:hypothetical protein